MIHMNKVLKKSFKVLTKASFDFGSNYVVL